MPSIGRNTKSIRLDQLTDEQIQKRWQALFPKFIMGAVISLAVTLAIFLFNHFGKPSQHLTDILSAAFQVAIIFTVTFAFMTAIGAYFKSGAWIKRA